MNLTYFALSEFTPEYIALLRGAARSVFEDGVKLTPTNDPWRAQLHLDPNNDSREYLRDQFLHFYNLVPWPGHDHETLYLDIETYSIERRWNMPPEQYFRLGQYAWGIDGEVQITTDFGSLLTLIQKAYGVVGHNIHMFDLPVMFGADDMTPLFMTENQQVFDTFIHANLVNPAPYLFTDRKGHTWVDATKPDKARRWLSLDNQCFVLGVPGKVEELKELAKKHSGFDSIPIDDPEFLAYAKQDVVSLQGLTRELLAKRPLEPYDWREQLVAAFNARMMCNGIMVDTAAAQARVDELQAQKDELLAQLEAEYDFPTEGKMPWRTNQGKDAIFKLLENHGITEATRPDWTRTATGNLSLGGEVMLALTDGTELESLGVALATLMGQRALAQQALDCADANGFAHPEAMGLQRSGRFSTTKPSMTVWSARGPKAIEKQYFVAEPGYALLEFDYSSADARAVAAMSGDKEFAKRFEPGANPHDISGEIFYGKEAYWLNRDELRQLAKAAGLALGYRVRAKRLAAVLGVEQSEAQQFINNYEAAYPDVVRWQERVTEQGENGYVTNEWGRRMVVEFGRAFTQSAGLLGQNFTREVLVDGMIRMLKRDPELLRWLRFSVHDAVVASVPLDRVEYAQQAFTECLTSTHHGIEFAVACGDPAQNWYEAIHD